MMSPRLGLGSGAQIKDLSRADKTALKLHGDIQTHNYVELRSVAKLGTLEDAY